MKYFAIVLLAMSSSLLAEEKLTFEQLFDERIKANIEYFEKYTDEDEIDEIKKADKAAEDAFVELLKLIKSSKDIKLKYLTLKSEFLWEKSESLYDFHYDEGATKLNGKVRRAKMNERLKQLETMYKELQKEEK